MVESSPAVKRAVKEAMERIKSGKSERGPTRAETDAKLAARKKDREAKALDDAKKDAPNLAKLQKQHAEMTEKFNKLGGSDYQYADRDQNMSDDEREARDMQSSMNQLGNRINAIKKAGFKQGGKINLKDCGVSTAQKGKTNSNW
jgi:hypothetical protein